MERKLIKDIPMMPSKTKQNKVKKKTFQISHNNYHILWLTENQHSFAIETGVNSYPTILLFNSDSEPQLP